MGLPARLRRAALLVLALAFPIHPRAALPETPRLRVTGVEDGLPSSTVNGLAFDRAGYLWLATTDGLARHDGVGFRVWRHAPGDASSLPGNQITALHVDVQDRVWIAVEGRGFSVLDPARRALRHYAKATHAMLGSDDVWAFASQGDTLWLGTFGGGLHRMDGAGRITRHMPVDGDARSLPADTVLALDTDASGRLWVATTAGLAYWTGRDFQRIALPGPKPDAVVYSVTPEHGRLWVGTATGLYALEADGRWQVPEWSAMFAAPDIVFDVVTEPGGRRWLAGARQLWRVAPGEAPHPVPIGAHGPPRPILQILGQPDGALWVPVGGAGLGYLRADWRRLALHGRREGGLSADLYRGVATSRSGGLWVAGTQGELEFLRRDGAVDALPAGARARLHGHRWLSAVEDRRGRVWLGDRGTLVRVDRSGRVDQWTTGSAEDALPDGPVALLAVAPDGRLWLSCSGAGLQQRDPDTGRVLATIRPGPSQGLGVGDLEALGFAPDGALWVAGAFGLAVWDAEAGRLRRPTGIVEDDRVFGFAFTPEGGVWLQRLEGLAHYRREGGRWRLVERAGIAEGVPGLEGAGLVVDARGRVWLASRRGLFRWDPKARRLRQFGLGDGLASQEFNERALVLGRDGVLSATLADGGVVQLDTKADDPVPLQAPLRVDAVETRREGRWQPLDAAAPVLGPDEAELRVVLRLLAYDNPRAHRYQTRLIGHDRDWVTHGGADAGERVFASLAPGMYRLQARAYDATGRMVAMAPLRIEVQAPWWRTPWALGAFALVAALLAWGLVRVRRARVRRRERWQQAERERELAHEASLAKSQFLATLGHEVRTPMTGVLGMSELLLDTPLTAQQRGYIESIHNAGEHLLRLVNDALDLARVEAGRLDLGDEPFDLHGLIDDIARFMAPLAQRRGLGFTLERTDDVPQGVRGDASRVRQILLNLLGNALKFTERGNIGLAVRVEAGGVRFTVHDTGPGLAAEQCARLFRRFEQADGARTAARYGGSGLGLAICQELAAAMGGRIGVDSVPGQGARFMVDLPLVATSLRPVEPVEPVPVASRSLRLLLVEDDITVAQVVISLLQAQGHSVTHVAHGLAALTELATSGFDLAFLDLDLPGMDGIALARHLRSLELGPPLVALTARADAEAERDCLAAGFDRFLRKPVTGAVLAETIDALCGCRAS